ncbi:MAG: PA0069 family radical SAM protein [Candidatus Dadabacteria bacterium]|nr:PA0069 family radical SAM protein [Candidatus Dadabacteria bacterium]NIS09145.1 PA0069 family radical SAM protein [Candidatus Dadabacteria bacterium]NIY22452.1 PA0069 family radical SAM protein [Candidatus Dadabacteria bacterium]
MSSFNQKIKGRGTSDNPANRFDKIDFAPDEEFYKDERKPKTEFFRDTSKTIIAYNNSPDIKFDASINPYRGCEHGCAYCYARPNHEHLGMSAGLDFETKIFVKENAAELLRKELSSKKWKPQTIAISGITDPYQPCEKHFGLTRSCLEVLHEYKNPVGIVTKNKLVTRDKDILKELANINAATVTISVTTLDSGLARLMEPRTSQPKLRLEAISELRDCGIPVGVLVAPVIPGLTDYEMPEIIKKSVEAGALYAGYVMLRLPFGVKDIFSNWLDQHYPDRKNKVLNRVLSVRAGKMYDPQFFHRQRGEGVFADQAAKIFEIACRKNGIENNSVHLSTDHFTNAVKKQLELF